MNRFLTAAAGLTAAATLLTGCTGAVTGAVAGVVNDKDTVSAQPASFNFGKYKRGEFGAAWTDNNTAAMGRNGCDTRNDILRRDLRNITVKANSNGCVVLTGVLYNKYVNNSVVRFVKGNGNLVDIDHKIPLKLAWDMGANKWSKAKRVNFANDPINLIAVDASSNRKKGDKGPSVYTGRPSNKAYHCTYARDFETVAKTYGLTIRKADQVALNAMKATC